MKFLEWRKSKKFSLPPLSPSSRILICEHKRDSADALALIFQQEGYQTDIAHSGAQAQRLLRKNRYDAMTLDLMLHDQSGLLLLRKLRRSVGTRALPVIVISMLSEKSQKQLEREEFVMVEWLPKPIDSLRILELIHATRRENGSSLAADKLILKDIPETA